MGDSELPGKEIPESIFADDDGSADAVLAQALIRHGRGKAHLSEVVEALAYARVLVPVLASGNQRVVGKHGLEQDEVASAGVVAVELPDGRSALPVFTDVDAMRAWNPAARPIPAEGPRAALAAVAEGWSVLLINPARETVAIPRPAVWALGRGEVWRPAVVGGSVAPEVRAAVRDAVTLDGSLLEADAVPGTHAEVAVVLGLAPGLDRDELNALVARVQEELAASEVVAERVDSLQLRVVQAD
jgi:hypothetical protein